MNNAYRAYLTEMLDDYEPNDDDRKAISRFLEWVDDHDAEEPDLYTYGDGRGEIAVDYVDSALLEEYGVDVSGTPSGIIQSVLTRWADNINLKLNSGNGKETALNETLRQIAAERNAAPAGETKDNPMY